MAHACGPWERDQVCANPVDIRASSCDWLCRRHTQVVGCQEEDLSNLRQALRQDLGPQGEKKREK